ncbi:MAG: LysM peptidoglycan-binding domain-containing protein, partial [Bacteroidales bacterium]|nr:LysM peptidoglycan-binding domain-containing protein [Bacteroidales bacterium]
MKYLYSIFLIIFLGITSITLNAQEDSFGTHTVKSGETLYSIAKAYFVTVNDLKEYNTEIENTNIKVGDTLKIPKTVRNSSMFVSDSDAIDEQALFPSSNNKNKTKKEKNETKVQQNKTRKEKTEIKIAMMLPLFYENIDDL